MISKPRSRTAEPLNAIHTAFVKYSEDDGSPNLDYEWIPPEQSEHIAKPILKDLEADGFQVVKKAADAKIQPAKTAAAVASAVAASDAALTTASAESGGPTAFRSPVPSKASSRM